MSYKHLITDNMETETVRVTTERLKCFFFFDTLGTKKFIMIIRHYASFLAAIYEYNLNKRLRIPSYDNRKINIDQMTDRNWNMF